MSSPPILPISNAQPSTEASITTPAAFPLFVNRVTDTVRNGFVQGRPWLELVDRSAFAKPESFSEAAIRLRKNYSYFKMNYLAVIAVVLGVSLITNPLSLLFLVGLLAAWIFYLFRPSDQPLVLLGRYFSDLEALGSLIFLSIIVFFLTSVGSVLISSLLAGVAVVLIHGAFRVPDDLYLNEPEPATTGFLSFVGTATSNAAAATPGVAPRA